MKRFAGVGLVCVLLALTPAWGSSPGERIGGEDLVLQLQGLTAATFVGVDLSFDYTSCDIFPTPVDLRCGLLASGRVDAEGRQYASRYTNSTVSAVLPRTEIWRTRTDGGAEMVAYLEPRAAGGGTYDDGRIERIAVDSVRGELLIQLTTTCYPINAPACTYDRAQAIVRVTGLKTLAEVLNPVAGAAGSDDAGVARSTPIGKALVAPTGKQRGSR